MGEGEKRAKKIPAGEPGSMAHGECDLMTWKRKVEKGGAHTTRCTRKNQPPRARHLGSGEGVSSSCTLNASVTITVCSMGCFWIFSPT